MNLTRLAKGRAAGLQHTGGIRIPVPAVLFRPDPLSGPARILTGDQLPPSDPGHWHPRHDEPVYAAVYAQHRDRLFAGLLSGAIGEAVTS